MQWGILGAARINRSIIPALRAAEGHTLEAIASRDADKAAAAAAEWGIPRSVASYEAMLAYPEIDAVYIPLPNHLHVEWTLHASRPASTCCARSRSRCSVEDVDRLAAAAARTASRAEAFMYRHHPLIQPAAIARGAIGPLALVLGSFTFTLTDPTTSAWTRRWAAARSGTSAAIRSASRGLAGPDPEPSR